MDAMDVNQTASEANDKKKSFYIKTFGCQMNSADTERMAAILTEVGMESSDIPEEADVIVINGCSVREKPVHKAVSALGTFQFLKRRNSDRPNPILALGGCVGQLEKDQLFHRAPYLDFVFGPDAIDALPEMIHQAERGHRHFTQTEFDPGRTYSTQTKIHRRTAQAFVNIMKGCDKFCTYCIVPFTRGREKSRTIDEVVTDIAQLVVQGVREVTLLGQNVNSFGKGSPNAAQREPQHLTNAIGRVGPREGDENFPQLLRAIDQDPRCSELKRIRFTSSHPLDFSDELIECYASPEQGGVQRLARQLHLPVQSGSDRVLEKMGRHHRIDHYVAQMKRLKELCPDVGMSTDMIVGFPTETEEDFQATLRLLDVLQFDQIYAFAYSPRPGTKADKLPDDVPDAEKNRRLNALLDHQMEISRNCYQKRVGRRMEVLVEGLAKGDTISAKFPDVKGRVWNSRTECGRIVNFLSDIPRDLTGQFVEVPILDSTPLSLMGVLRRTEL